METDRVKKMTYEKDSVGNLFSIFMKIINNEELPICFEGEDIKYYRERIERHLTENFSEISCNGKEKVIELRNKIKKNETYKDEKCLYFLDCDFDDNTSLLNEDDIYITPCYSIENLYLSDLVLEKIIKDEFRLNPNIESQKQLFDDILSLFRERKKEFLEHVRTFNYYIYLIKRKKISDISFRDIGIDKLVKFSLNSLIKTDFCISGEISKKYDLNEFIIKESEEYFSDKEAEKYFRGKNNFQFLEKFLNKLIEDANKKDNKREFFDKKISIKYSTNNLLSNASKYAETPDCLIKFLQKHKL